MKYIAMIDGDEHVVDPDEAGEVAICDGQHTAHLEGADQDVLFTLLVGEVPFEVEVADERSWRVCEIATKAGADVGEAVVRSPMPGLVVDVLVAEGQLVEAGDGVAILEAMKMENEIRAPRGGVVQSVQVEIGQVVNLDDVIVHIVPPCEN